MSRRYASVDDVFTRLRLPPIPLPEFVHILETHAHDPVIQRFHAVDTRSRECGDEKSGAEFYRSFYVDRVPVLNIPWAEAYTRVYHPGFEAAVLPELARFCDEPERRLRVIDLGCGDGFVLCYLASQFPDVAFVGVDVRPEALTVAQQRLDLLGLRNVRLVEGDTFALNRGEATIGGVYDGAILRNILDDSREAWTPYLDAQFDTVRKLRALRPLLTTNARVWVSLTPCPHGTPEFEARVRTDIAEAGFSAFPALPIPYSVYGRQVVHLTWTVCPRIHTREIDGDFTHRPE